MLTTITKACRWVLRNGFNYCVNSSDNDLSNRVLDGSGVTKLDFFKKDVYDIGILLLELITGKTPIQIYILLKAEA